MFSLANACGCHVSTISKAEAGVHRPRPALFHALAVELECPIEDLMNTAPRKLTRRNKQQLNATKELAS